MTGLGTASAGLYFDTVAADGPIAYWRLDETAASGPGDAVDAAGTNHGTYTNTAAITLGQAGPRPVDGFPGLDPTNNAPDFAGSGSGNVDLPHGFLPTGNAPRTFVGWFNGTSSSNQSWFNYGQNTTPNRNSITAGPNRVAVAVSGHNFGVDGAALGAGWHHIGIILPDIPSAKSDDWLFVIDGVDRTADATTLAGGPLTVNTIDGAGDPRRIGLNEGGLIDEVAVFDRALTVADIQKYYNAALGIAPPVKLLSVLPLEEFQTAADNGESPATSGVGSMPAGTELYVRERANEANPELEVRAFLKFDLSGLDSRRIESATLKLHEFDKLNSNTEDLFIAEVTENWDATVNKPSFGQLIDAGSEFTFGDNGTGGRTQDIQFEIDVTDIVRRWHEGTDPNYGLRLRIGDNFVAAAFDHAGALAPTLEIFQAPEPGGLVLLLAGLLLLLPLGCVRKAGRG